MTKTKAIKAIFGLLKNHGIYGGLPRAVEIYNYLSAHGEIEVTGAMIMGYFSRR